MFRVLSCSRGRCGRRNSRRCQCLDVEYVFGHDKDMIDHDEKFDDHDEKRIWRLGTKFV